MIGKMRMRYLDEKGNECTPIMGCYGIGIGRLMASVIEARHDNSPDLATVIAPFKVHIITIDLKEAENNDVHITINMPHLWRCHYLVTGEEPISSLTCYCLGI
jgi:prolyl-tRNA synthetase